MNIARFFALIFLFTLLGCGAQRIEVKLPDGFTVRAEVAQTQQQTERGLMYRQHLAADEGMLFIFERDAPRLFWMKNTFVPLDIIFIDAQKRITSVRHNAPRSYKTTPEHQVATAAGFGQYVLEVPAGTAAAHNLQVGQELNFL